MLYLLPGKCRFPCTALRFCCFPAASCAIKAELGVSSFAQLTFIFGQKDNLFNPTISSMRGSFLHQFCAPEGKELFKASSLTWILCDVIASRAWKSMRSNGKSLSFGRYASCSAKACCHGYISVWASLSLSQRRFFCQGRCLSSEAHPVAGSVGLGHGRSTEAVGSR